MDSAVKKNNRTKSYEMLCICSLVILITSGCATIVGFVSIGLFACEGWMPYALGASLFSAFFAAVPAIFGIVAYRKGLAEEAGVEKTQQASYGVKCWIIASFVMSTANVTFLLLFTATGVIGLVLCGRDAKECKEYHDAKIIMSVFTVVFCLALWILNFGLLIWFCQFGQILGLNGRVSSKGSGIQRPLPPNATAM